MEMGSKDKLLTCREGKMCTMSRNPGAKIALGGSHWEACKSFALVKVKGGSIESGPAWGISVQQNCKAHVIDGKITFEICVMLYLWKTFGLLSSGLPSFPNRRFS